MIIVLTPSQPSVTLIEKFMNENNAIYICSLEFFFIFDISICIRLSMHVNHIQFIYKHEHEHGGIYYGFTL